MSVVTTWRSDVYHLPFMCHVYIEVGVKFSTSVFVTLFFFFFFENARTKFVRTHLNNSKLDCYQAPLL
jgi:hypothetical protein